MFYNLQAVHVGHGNVKYGDVRFFFPDLLQCFKAVSAFIPVTYGIRAIELAVYKGYPPALLRTEISALILFSLVLLPLGMLFFRYAVIRAKRDGSLAHY